VTKTDRIAAAADIIASARVSKTLLALLPEAIRPRDEAESYAVQQAVHRRLEDTPVGARIGYKIGCTTKVMQDYLGLRSPCAAGVFSGVVHKSGARLAANGYSRLGIECEIAVQLGLDLPPRGAPYTAATVRDAVAAWMTAIEIVDDRYTDWKNTDAATLIADDYFAAGCILGPPVGDVADASILAGTTVINGREAGRGRGSDVLGHPLNALAWLANNLAARNRTLHAGEIVLTGSLVETKWLTRGDHAVVTVGGLGSVELTVV
jgi:2-keto-4-pentenoate hydratase